MKVDGQSKIYLWVIFENFLARYIPPQWEFCLIELFLSAIIMLAIIINFHQRIQVKGSPPDVL